MRGTPAVRAVPLAVADVDRAGLVRAERRERVVHHVGRGLAAALRRLAHGDVGKRAEVLRDQRTHRLVRLVGHHRKAEALRFERRHQLQNARVGLRLDLAMRGVVRLVKRERLRDGLLVRVCAEGAAHLHLRAVADEAPHLRERPLGIAQLPQRVVRRTADVLERVEQRPVKVK